LYSIIILFFSSPKESANDDNDVEMKRAQRKKFINWRKKFYFGGP
jgi:hypothetical protein